MFLNWGNFIAHRALLNQEDGENSKKAIQRCIDKNLPIEIDVQFHQSGQFLVFHDDNLKRMFGYQDPIRDVNLKVLPHLTDKFGNKILSLDELLDFINGRVPILIEVKSGQKDSYTEKMYQMDILSNQLKNYQGPFAIQSFDPIILRLLRSSSKSFILGHLICSWFKQDLSLVKKLFLSSYAGVVGMNLNFIAVEKDIFNQKAFLITKKLLGLPTLCWTIFDKTELNKVANKCDAVIFENGDVLL